MARHDVKFSVPPRPLGHADLEFVVDRDGAKLGTLKVSKGTVEWVKADHTHGHAIDWTKFAELMAAQGKNGHK